MNLDEELEFILSFIEDKNDYYEMSTHEALKLVILAKAAKKYRHEMSLDENFQNQGVIEEFEKALEDVDKE